MQHVDVIGNKKQFAVAALEVVEDPVHFYTLTVSGPVSCSVHHTSSHFSLFNVPFKQRTSLLCMEGQGWN